MKCQMTRPDFAVGPSKYSEANGGHLPRFVSFRYVHDFYLLFTSMLCMQLLYISLLFEISLAYQVWSLNGLSLIDGRAVKLAELFVGHATGHVSAYKLLEILGCSYCMILFNWPRALTVDLSFFFVLYVVCIVPFRVLPCASSVQFHLLIV